MNYNTLRESVQCFLKRCVPDIHIIYTNFTEAKEFDDAYVSVSHCWTDSDTDGYVEIVVSRVNGSLMESCISHIRITDHFHKVPESAIGTDKQIN